MTYLLVSHIPIYTEGSDRYLSTDWKRSLELLRDSFEGKFGPITLLAPSIPLANARSEQLLESIQEKGENIQLIPGPDLRGSAMQYWREQNAGWKALVQAKVSAATVVHAGIDQLWKPIQYRGFIEGYRQNKPTVFVADTDLVTQILQLAQEQPAFKKIKDTLYAHALDKIIAWSVAKADLSLLKGRGLHARYGSKAKNARDFQDTSFSRSDVIREEKLTQRISKMLVANDLRFVYCGRLEPRKGILNSIRLVHEAKKRQIPLFFDIIGDGLQREQLEHEVQILGLENAVHFLGAQSYGPALFNKLYEYDALLFTPEAEDTPRMIFDGFAAGLPLLGHNIPYAREVLAKNPAGLLWEKGRGLDCLVRVFEDRSLLADLALRARALALYHAADVWYKRRAEWTFEAVKLHEAKTKSR